MENIPLVQRVDFIKNLCEGKKVLHLGCTNYPYTKDSIDNNVLLHFELERISRSIYGFDYDQAGIDILEANGTKNLFRADLEKLDEVQLSETFDVIIAGEVIEHLNNPGLFLSGIQRFMHAETDLVITTINAYSALRFFIYAFGGKGGKNEPVHPDHVFYFSYKTLRLLIERANLSIKHFCFYDIGIEHRVFNRGIYNFINDVCVKFFHQLSDGVIAVCKLKEPVA